jgi:hypothetical protein
MAVPGASERIHQAVLQWPGVVAHPHRFGGIEFRLGRRKIGHIHGDWLVDIPFPKKVRDQLVQQGRARPHQILGDSGWVSCYLGQPEDVELAVELLRTSYEIAVRQKERRRRDNQSTTMD